MIGMGRRDRRRDRGREGDRGGRDEGELVGVDDMGWRDR